MNSIRLVAGHTTTEYAVANALLLRSTPSSARYVFKSDSVGSLPLLQVFSRSCARRLYLLHVSSGRFPVFLLSRPIMAWFVLTAQSVLTLDSLHLEHEHSKMAASSVLPSAAIRIIPSVLSISFRRSCTSSMVSHVSRALTMKPYVGRMTLPLSGLSVTRKWSTCSQSFALLIPAVRPDISRKSEVHGWDAALDRQDSDVSP